MLGLISLFKLISLIPNQIINSLAKIYIKDKIIPDKYFTDALHIACASLNNIEFLLTFNIEHMLKT
jgi:hypothetical protein